MLDEDSDEYAGQRSCCLAGAIKIKNPDTYNRSAGRIDGYKKSRIGYMSQLCIAVQAEKYGKDSQTMLPTLDDLLTAHKAGIVDEYDDDSVGEDSLAIAV